MNNKDNQEAEREAFEKWAEERGWGTEKHYYGAYKIGAVSSAFEAWQARATLSPQVNEEVASGEVVAWRILIGDSDVWSFAETEEDADFYGKQSGLNYVKQPLYLHPPTPSPSNVLVEALQLLIEKCDESDECQYGTLGTDFVRHISTQALANYSASTDSVSISRSEYEALVADKERLDFLQKESYDLRSLSAPTGGDDYDIHWVVIAHYMEKPQEREVARGYNDNLREAIDTARKSS